MDFANPRQAIKAIAAAAALVAPSVSAQQDRDAAFPHNDFRAAVRENALAASTKPFNVDIRGVNIKSDLSPNDLRARGVSIAPSSPYNSRPDEVVDIATRAGVIKVPDSAASVQLSPRLDSTEIFIVDKPVTRGMVTETKTRLLVVDPRGVLASNTIVTQGKMGSSDFVLSNTNFQDLAAQGIEFHVSKKDQSVTIKAPAGSQKLEAGSLMAVGATFGPDGRPGTPVIYVLGRADSDLSRSLQIVDPRTGATEHRGDLSSREVASLLRQLQR